MLNILYKGFVITANGDDITEEFNQNENFTKIVRETVDVERGMRESDGRVTLTASFPSGTSLTILIYY